MPRQHNSIELCGSMTLLPIALTTRQRPLQLQRLSQVTLSLSFSSQVSAKFSSERSGAKPELRAKPKLLKMPPGPTCRRAMASVVSTNGTRWLSRWQRSGAEQNLVIYSVAPPAHTPHHLLALALIRSSSFPFPLLLPLFLFLFRSHLSPNIFIAYATPRNSIAEGHVRLPVS